MSDTVFFNGTFVDDREAVVQMSSRATMKADGVFEATRTFNGQPYLLDLHLDRLYRSLKGVRIEPGITQEEMTELTHQALEANKHALGNRDAQIMHVITRGAGTPYVEDRPDVYIRAKAIDETALRTKYLKGVTATITSVESYRIQTVDPSIKHFNRMNFTLAEIEANQRRPGSEAILRDSSGAISEGTRQNVFIVQGNMLRTPALGSILDGISRRVVLDLGERLGYDVREERLSPLDVRNADEAFFTGTSPCMIPIVEVDGLPIGEGTPGRAFKQILKEWGRDLETDLFEDIPY